MVFRSIQKEIIKTRLRRILVSIFLVIFIYWIYSSLQESPGSVISYEHNIIPNSANHPNPRLANLIDSLLIKRNKYKYLTVVAANNGHVDLTLNWVESFNHCFNDNETNHFLIVAMDHIIYQKLLSKSIPTVLAEDLVSEKHFLPPPSEATFGVPEFAKLTRLKLHILLPLMKFYNVESILFSDVDIGFTNNSLFSYLDDIPQEKEIAIASDDMNSLETLCSCFFLIRNTKRVIQLFEDFRLISNEYNEKKIIGERGQQLLNAYVRHKTPNMKDILFNLPMGQFPNGQALLDGYPTRVNMVPWIIHANFLVGSYSKICFLKKYNVWFLEYSWWYSLMSLYENIRFISYGVATFFGFKMIHD